MATDPYHKRKPTNTHKNTQIDNVITFQSRNQKYQQHTEPCLLLTFPIESPPATESITPTTLQNSVLMRTTCGILMPFKKHLI